MTFKLGDVVVFKAFPNYKMVVLATPIATANHPIASVGWFGHDKVLHEHTVYQELLRLFDGTDKLAETLLQQIATSTDAEWGRQLARDYFKMEPVK